MIVSNLGLNIYIHEKEILSFYLLCEDISLMLIKIQRSEWISEHFIEGIESTTASYTTAETYNVLTS